MKLTRKTRYTILTTLALLSFRTYKILIIYYFKTRKSGFSRHSYLRSI